MRSLLLLLTGLLGVWGAAGDGRRARMPDFAKEQVAGHYSAGLASLAIPRVPPSVNNLRVKTNNTRSDGKNVAMNINIPASISGYLLKEIDLKYTKKTNKKARGNDVASLMIKYFTNKSSNLHLSSVTKSNEVRRDHLNIGDKYRKSDNEIDRPFFYQQKYPLRLLEKIREASSRRKNRRGKAIKSSSSPMNLLSTDGVMKVNLKGASLDDIDMDVLDAISVTPAEATNNFMGNGGMEDELSIPELYELFENVGQFDIDEEVDTDKKDISKSAHNSISWIGSIVPNILSVMPNSFKSSVFKAHARQKRDIPEFYTKFLSNLEKKAKKTGASFSTGKSNSLKNVSSTSYENPTLWFKKNILKLPSSFELMKDKSPRRETSKSSTVSFDDVSNMMYTQQNEISFTPGKLSNNLYQKRLSKLDYIFSSLKVQGETCRQRVLCEVARNQQLYAPLSDIIAKETNIQGNMRQVGRSLLESEEGARLFSYIEAGRRGELTSRGCEVYRYRCRTSAREVIDTSALAMWREISSWLTIKLLAANTH